MPISIKVRICEDCGTHLSFMDCPACFGSGRESDEAGAGACSACWDKKGAWWCAKCYKTAEAIATARAAIEAQS